MTEMYKGSNFYFFYKNKGKDVICHSKDLNCIFFVYFCFCLCFFRAKEKSNQKKLNLFGLENKKFYSKNGTDVCDDFISWTNSPS